MHSSWMNERINARISLFPEGEPLKPIKGTHWPEPLWKQQWPCLAHPEKVTGSKGRGHMAFKEKHGISCDFCTGNHELALNRWAVLKKTPELGPYCQSWVFCQRDLNPFSDHVGAHPGSSLKRPSDEAVVRLGRQLGKGAWPWKKSCRNHPKN